MRVNRIGGALAAGCVGAFMLSGTAGAADTKHPKPHHHHAKKTSAAKAMPGMPGMDHRTPNGQPGSGHYHCQVRGQAPADPAATNGASPYNPGSLQSHAQHTLNIVDAMNHCHVHEIPYAVYTPLQQAVHSPSQAPNTGPQALAQEGVILGQTSGEANGTLQPLITAQAEELARLTGHH